MVLYRQEGSCHISMPIILTYSAALPEITGVPHQYAQTTKLPLARDNKMGGSSQFSNHVLRRHPSLLTKPDRLNESERV